MAQSRLEKIGTIYTRATGLIKSGSMNWEDRPLWYDVYQAHPPKEEPNFDRPAPQIPLKKIFYEEDKIRAVFHKHNKNIGATNLFDNKYKTLTQKFIDNYRKIEAQYGGQGSSKQIYEEAIELLKREKEDEDVSLSSAFKEAEAEKTNLNIRKCDRSTIFSPVDNPFVTTSFTTPSMCDGHSTTLSLPESANTNSSASFSWSRMQNLVLQQETLTQDVLQPAVLKVASQVLDCLKRNVKAICDDFQEESKKFPETIFERFRQHTKPNTTSSSNTSTISVAKRIVVHFVTALYVQDMILNYFINGEQELALDLLKQVAVSHALKGVTCSEFRMLDWFRIHFIVKNKLVNEETVNLYVTYLNILSNYITRYYESQRIRQKMVDELTTEKENDRSSKARENYRLMKKWKLLIDSFQDQDKVVDDLFARLEKKNIQPTESIDTLTLKRNDCVMKHFIKKEVAQKESETSVASPTAPVNEKE